MLSVGTFLVINLELLKSFFLNFDQILRAISQQELLFCNEVERLHVYI